MPAFSKRKRSTRGLSFPPDVKDTWDRRGTCEMPQAAKSSWDRCGDSFLDVPVTEKHDATRRTSLVLRQLAQTSPSGGEDPVHIAWTSSEDEDADDERPLRLPFAAAKATRRSRVTLSRYSRFLSAGADTDELPSIDSESEHEDVSTSKDQICAVAAEILDYSSSSDGDADTSRLDRLAQEPPEQPQRSISEWLRSAQALLQTPPRRTDKHTKTPEDSGKKKRKFERGGLAERLNRLQCRQRSAISFWRHQPVSGVTTGAEERPGVLVLRVQNTWEVCGMRAALCWRHPEGETCVALFSKETAAQLAPGAGDTVHVHPPWQSLTVDGEPHPIILNTHFSQKVLAETKQDDGVTCSMVLGLKEKTKPYPLTRCLWKREEHFKSSPASGSIKHTQRDAGGAFESILEALEACKASGSACGPVEAVVQRVYFESVVEFPHTGLPKHRTLSGCLSGKAPRRRVDRCCILVQDVYGMFSEVEMQYASSDEDLNNLTEQLQGKLCLLQGLKVLQRLTRERCAQVFSLIDSLWPPAVPVRVLGEDSCCQTGTAAAPSFCYRLAGARASVLPKLESPLYRPPLIQTLREILQVEPVCRRCSFKGTLVYKREQPAEEEELSLFVTDSSLQDQQNSGTVKRTLPVYVSSAFLLRPSVRQAIAALSPHFRPRLIFRDAMIDRGKIIVSVQTVVQLDTERPQIQDVSSPQAVLLDELSPESPAGSLCTVNGVVTDIDESSAFSWPVCSWCGGDALEAVEDKQDVFLCVACGVVDKPRQKMQLEVFLSCPSPSHWTVRVKLQQNSIMSLLNSTGPAEGYEVEAVLGQSVGPLSAFIHVVTRSSALWMGLEEITLCDPGGH
ncbi:DNA repair-scaffolding protein isoform 2-T2 [Clarias gariepinus]|uniref:DNA repair-scaffolding protein isoform X2 n=1 Tax=Clarias gariepinus TaxID=13013 RepID=UPI00234DAD76|nr:DNA repair-scaffolding protein isoform X2 [Clarias gariepinus]